MKKIFFIVLSLALLSVAWTNRDYTPVNKASAIDGAGYDDFAEYFPTGDSDVVEIQYRSGTDRESTVGSIYTLDYTISTDTYGSPTLLFSCPGGTLDATNPTFGQIGTTIYSLVNCKETDNSDSTLYLASRSASGTSANWSSFAVIYDQPGTSNGWGRLVPTRDSNTYWWPISGNSPASPIFQLKTTDGGTTWSRGETMVGSPSNWSEATCAYIPDYKSHICIVRNDNGDYVSQIVSTDGYGRTWTSPTPTNLGASSGVKLSTLFFDSTSESLVLFFADRNNTTLYFSLTKPYSALDAVWGAARQLSSSVSNEATYYETDTSDRTFRLLVGVAGGTGGGRIDDLTFKSLGQTLTFGQIGP